MDYERIRKKPLGGGFSPGKLRTMLLGVEKKRHEGEEDDDDDVDSESDFRSHLYHQTGGRSLEQCKDVDVVSELPEWSVSSTADSMGAQMLADLRSKDHSCASSRTRSLDDSQHDSTSVSSASFEFQMAERPMQRVPLASFSKPAPSKWDDAQKWIASPTTTRPKMGQNQMHGGQGTGSRKMGNAAYLSRQSSSKVVVEVPEKKVVAIEEPDTKCVDSNQPNKEHGSRTFVSWEADSYSIADSYCKPVLMIENSVAESAAPSTARSVSMRDMGTEMTPIASQEPSRSGTPMQATTPIRSPSSSRPSTPGRAAPAPSPTNPFKDHLNQIKELTEKELQMKTRKEMVELGTQLGKMNIVAWASKEENKDTSAPSETIPEEQATKNVIDTRAAAWEEAEKAKYMARFKREEMKIQAWENHQKAKTEAEMRKIEVEVERMRGRAQEKQMNKLAATRHKAEEKRAAAEAKRNKEDAKTERQADYIRRTGSIPSSLSICSWCF